MVRSGRSAASGLNVRAGRGVQGQCHQRGLSSRSVPNRRAHHDAPAVLVPPRDAAVRARDLGGQRGGDLVLDHRVLHRGEQVLGLLQLQTQGVRRQGVAVQGERLAHHRLGVVIGVQHDLHGDLHAALVPAAASAARARFSRPPVEPLHAQQREQAGEFLAVLARTG